MLKMKIPHVIVYLNWPEKCFRASSDDIRFLRTLLPRGARITVVGSDEDLLKTLPRATHVITWHFRSEWYALAPNLTLVATPAAGRELVATAPKGSSCRVFHGGFHGKVISESVLAFVLAWTHGFFHVRTLPLWPRSKLAEVVDRDLAGSHAVILGYGRIGRAVAARLVPFGVFIFGYARHLKVSSRVLDRELRRADWLIAALPSDTGTDDLVGEELLSKLPKTCVFINVGRGNCVDEGALLDALRTNRLAGAYLDVYKCEPTVLAPKPGRSSGCGIDLAGLPPGECPWNLIRMPHASAYSPSYLRQAFQELKDSGLI